MQVTTEEFAAIQKIWDAYVEYCSLFDADDPECEEAPGILLHNGSWRKVPSNAVVDVRVQGQDQPSSI